MAADAPGNTQARTAPQDTLTLTGRIKLPPWLVPDQPLLKVADGAVSQLLLAPKWYFIAGVRLATFPQAVPRTHP